MNKHPSLKLPGASPVLQLFHLTIHPPKKHGERWWISSKEFKGCFADGTTFRNALLDFHKALKLHNKYS